MCPGPDWLRLLSRPAATPGPGGASHNSLPPRGKVQEVITLDLARICRYQFNFRLVGFQF